jgi:Na+-translocating ferredoxin:NAD+ oxidoreductase RnfC subunit
MMNERIRELVKQAGVNLSSFQFSGTPTKYEVAESELEKFAELIVRECATAITDDDLAKDCDTFLMDSYAKGMRYSAHLIKEHFGIEA